MQPQDTKPYEIDRWLVQQAYEHVKSKSGGAGVDGVSIAEFDSRCKDNLYKLWNRMSSGSYFPPAVKLVEIPKGNGGLRPLGIPTVGDRVAQKTACLVLEPLLEPHFHPDSYAYRPGRSAHDALSKARQRCWQHDWVLDMDISKFFDTIDHELLMKAVRRHTDNRWVLLYIERWLKVPYALPDGTLQERTVGVPQGSVIGPVLANLFLHYAFDLWMATYHPHIPFERYADDSICHCRSLREAQELLKAVSERFAQCKLSLNLTKTKIVYCKDDRRQGEYETVCFDFLGFTFSPRRAKGKSGISFTGFIPAISRKAMNKIREEVRGWRLNSRIHGTFKSLARLMNPSVRGWVQYYGKFYPSVLKRLFRYLNETLARWVTRKYKRIRRKFMRAYYWLGDIARRDGNLFYHWQWGIIPPQCEHAKRKVG